MDKQKITYEDITLADSDANKTEKPALKIAKEEPKKEESGNYTMPSWLF